MQARRKTARHASSRRRRHASAGARDARVKHEARAHGGRRRADSGRIASGAPRGASLGRDGALGRIGAPEGGFERRSETGLDLARELADEHRAVLAAEGRDGLVYSVALYEERAVWVDIADGAEDAQQVQLDDRLAVAELLGDAPEELRFGDADGDRRRVAAYFEERVEQVLERACFGRDETLEKRVERLGFRELVLYASRLLLKPKQGGIDRRLLRDASRSVLTRTE